jgi:hypothetical protein
MPSIINVLTDSFQLLREEPRFFVPKLVSTFLGALWAIGLLSRTGPLHLYALTGLPLAAVALFVSVMLASMVENRESGSVLRDGFHGALVRWREILVSFFAFMLAVVVLYIPFAVGFVSYYFSGELLLLAAGIFLSLLMLVAFSFLSYFFPISLLQEESVLDGFRDSVSTSLGNSREVLPLTLLSFALLGVAAVTPDAGMAALGYTGFFVMRMISGVVTTYIFVVSPNYYLRS